MYCLFSIGVNKKTARHQLVHRELYSTEDIRWKPVIRG
jgi:hypothetical protein